MLFVSVVILMIFSSSFAIEGTVAKVGSLAPDVEMLNDADSSSIEDYRGKYLLLTFWSSTDGRSRLKCNQYNSFFKRQSQKEGENQVEFVAVNFDKNKVLFDELVRYDNLIPGSQYYVSEKEFKQISRAYNLFNGLKSYLIDPSGRIVMVNPDESQLTKIMSN